MGRFILYSITAAVPVSAGLARTPVAQVLAALAAVVIGAAVVLAVASTLSLLAAAALTARAHRRLRREQSLKVPVAHRPSASTAPPPAASRKGTRLLGRASGG